MTEAFLAARCPQKINKTLKPSSVRLLMGESGGGNGHRTTGPTQSSSITTNRSANRNALWYVTPVVKWVILRQTAQVSMSVKLTCVFQIHGLCFDLLGEETESVVPSNDQEHSIYIFIEGSLVLPYYIQAVAALLSDKVVSLETPHFVVKVKLHH
ncbi:hypothetical protein ILYODFUR_034252 [Ilyodon furcidens]|uniref:Uncharacterized protein n=1 Tax=Ilyodon furcidens TaxID=33524 RepID=A0ABV0ULD5_9TELE